MTKQKFEQDFLDEFNDLLSKINPENRPDMMPLTIIVAFTFSCSLTFCFTKIIDEMAKANNPEELTKQICCLGKAISGTSKTLFETYKTDKESSLYSAPETNSIN